MDRYASLGFIYTYVKSLFRHFLPHETKKIKVDNLSLHINFLYKEGALKSLIEEM